MSIYFDNAATTAVRREVIDVMSAVMRDDYGNPSSSHTLGRRATTLLEDARESVAVALGAETKRIFFTSGGTESCNLAILRSAHINRYNKRHSAFTEGLHIITSATEHDAVKAPLKKLEGEGWDVTYLAPDSAGRIPVSSFSGALRDNTVFASIMLVNNETGAVNPVGDYAREIKRRGLGTVLHTDAVQGFCKVPFSVRSLGADLITVSAHKLHGPKGIGALYASEKVKLSPLILGGGQEKNMRSGTEAMPAVAGFGEAVRLCLPEIESAAAIVRGLREHTAGLLKSEFPDAVIIGEGDCPYILCLSLPGFKSEVLLNFLDSEGIYVSKGAACKKGARSPALEAMRLPVKVIDGVLRVSFSQYNTFEETERFIEVLKKAHDTLVH